jgi:hypothetical protein
MPSPAAAAAAPFHRIACARQHLPQTRLFFLPSRALLKSDRLTVPAPLRVHALRLPPTVPRAASHDAATGVRSPTSGGQMLVRIWFYLPLLVALFIYLFIYLFMYISIYVCIYLSIWHLARANALGSFPCVVWVTHDKV